MEDYRRDEPVEGLPVSTSGCGAAGSGKRNSALHRPPSANEETVSSLPPRSFAATTQPSFFDRESGVCEGAVAGFASPRGWACRKRGRCDCIRASRRAMPAPPKVFISAVSGDLRGIRQIVKEALLTIHCHPVEQTNFAPDWRTVGAMLRGRIEDCQALIHIAGMRYGAEPDPATLPPGAARRSYTPTSPSTSTIWPCCSKPPTGWRRRSRCIAAWWASS